MPRARAKTVLSFAAVLGAAIVGNAKGKKILLVEDEAVIAMAGAAALRGFGYRVSIAVDGESAVEAATGAEELDLVLMDIDLGEGIDGTEAARRILADRDLPIVFLSSHAEEAYVERVREITRYGYIIKNSGDFVLRSSVEMAFELFEANASYRRKVAELEESEKSLSLTLQAIGDAVVSTDLEGRVTRMNRTAERLSGWPAGAALGHPLESVFHLVDAGGGELEPDPVGRALGGDREEECLGECLLLGRTRNFRIGYRSAPIADAQGELHGAIFVFSEAKPGELDRGLLDESEGRFRRFSEASPMGLHIYRLGEESSLILSQANPAADRELGMPNASLLGRTIEELFPWMAQTEAPQRLREVAEEGHIWRAELDRAPGGPDSRIFGLVAFRVSSREIAVLFSDVTARRGEERRSKRNEAFLEGLLETIPLPVFAKDRGGRYLRVNRAFGSFLGVSPDTLQGKDVFDVYPEDLARTYRERDEDLLRQGGVQVYETKLSGADGAMYDIIAHKATFAGADGEVAGLIGVIEDITERKRADEEIRRLLAEKELVLREVHHRIKNNMKTVESLLELQAEAAENVPVREALSVASGRVRSMMLLYDKLYRAPQTDSLSLATYLPDLVRKVVANFPRSEAVRVAAEIEDIAVDAKRLSVLGMIVNELVSNSMKYAFRSREQGMLAVSATLAPSGHVRLSVGDDGPGMPDSTDFDNSTGFGLSLVALLAKQLRGGVRIEREAGTKVVLEFPH